MKLTGIKITKTELALARSHCDHSGIFSESIVTPYGSPVEYVTWLRKKYNVPVEATLRLNTGEFVVLE